MINNPKVMAAICGLTAAWLIYQMATATESPSTALAVLQYVCIAGCLLGFAGAMRTLLSGKA